MKFGDGNAQRMAICVCHAAFILVGVRWALDFELQNEVNTRHTLICPTAAACLSDFSNIFSLVEVTERSAIGAL